MFSPKIEQWRAMVEYELKGIESDIPPTVMLAHIKKESGGNPKAYNKSGAAGLCQIKPITLKYFNDSTGNNYTEEDMLIPGANIKVGVFILNHYWNRVKTWFDSKNMEYDLADIVNIGAYAYLMGFKPVQNKLNELLQGGYTISWGTFHAQFPNWGWRKGYHDSKGVWHEGKWINKPLQYGEAIWTLYQTHKPLIEITKPLKQTDSYLIIGGLVVLGLVVALIVVAAVKS